MQTSNQNQDQQRRGDYPVNVAELAVRGSSALFDIQLATLRSMWQFQARAAAALGGPDYSELLRSADDSARQLVSTGTEQLLNSTRQASETVTEIQRQIGRLVEQGSQQLTRDVRQGIEQVSQRAQQSLDEVKTLVREGADEAERVVRDSGQYARQANGNGGPGAQSGESQPHGQVDAARAETARREAEERANRVRKTA